MMQKILMRGFFRAQAVLPRWVRVRLGNALGTVAFYCVPRRVHIADVNLQLCQPALSPAERKAMIRLHFQLYIRAVLDRSVLWFGSLERIHDMLQVEGWAHFEAAKGKPVLLLAPHFLGLDAGGIAFNLRHAVCSIYQRQSNAVFDALLYAGRTRLGTATVFARHEGVRPIMRAMKNGTPFYCLPDMDFGAKDAVFAPFFGQPAATLTVVPRMAHMLGAAVLPAITRMNDDGTYTLTLHAPLEFAAQTAPDNDPMWAGAAQMNALIEQHIVEMPAQYLWTHRRFKTRPTGQAAVY